MRYGQRRIVSNSTATRVSVKKLVSAFYSALQSEPAEETLGESVKKLKSAFYSALQSDPAEETPGGCPFILGNLFSGQGTVFGGGGKRGRGVGRGG